MVAEWVFDVWRKLATDDLIVRGLGVYRALGFVVLLLYRMKF